MAKILKECGDLTVQEATDAAKGILFENANRIYELELKIDDVTPTM